MIADKVCGSVATGRLLRRCGVAMIIFERAARQAGMTRLGSRGERPPVFDRVVHQRRNVVERCINRFQQWHGIATRFDELARNFRAAIVLVTALFWINV